MRILVLSKRQYTGQDLLDDHYGRLYEIPEHLARLGHEVSGLTMSYRKRSEGRFQDGQVSWQSFNGTPLGRGMLEHLKRVRQEIARFRPDVVWASSDMWHGIACSRVCSELKVPFVIDLYDNYESFLLSRIPGTLPLFKRACRRATGITAISEQLSHRLKVSYEIPADRILNLGNATNGQQFFRLDKDMARSALGLPRDSILVGTAGALGRGRGTEVILKAHPLLREQLPSLEIVLAGPMDASLKASSQDGVHYLGVLPPHEVPNFYNAMDVSLICNRPSAFGTYCYPQKLNEILACNTRLLAADVGEMSHLLARHPQHLFTAESEKSLADKILRLLDQATEPPLPPVFWEQRAQELSKFLQQRLER
ncbi:glycosyltransferase family 4 protein [Pseudomonas sp.]|uniref:glycosyltransferase family 4 protein n=2 Tax=unclassified Pseudomonas TaxID=196821 RepID=UPI0031D933A6